MVDTFIALNIQLLSLNDNKEYDNEYDNVMAMRHANCYDKNENDYDNNNLKSDFKNNEIKQRENNKSNITKINTDVEVTDEEQELSAKMILN